MVRENTGHFNGFFMGADPDGLAIGGHPLRQKVEVGYLAVGRAEGDFMPFATVQSLPWHPQRGLR
jgi:hypothetical protein